MSKLRVSVVCLLSGFFATSAMGDLGRDPTTFVGWV
jgi:hypothetical protein